MQMTFNFAGEITQVLDALPWVRCASGNVFSSVYRLKIKRGGSSEDGFGKELLVLAGFGKEQRALMPKPSNSLFC